LLVTVADLHVRASMRLYTIALLRRSMPQPVLLPAALVLLELLGPLQLLPASAVDNLLQRTP